jgi:hypothetical protein
VPPPGKAERVFLVRKFFQDSLKDEEFEKIAEITENFTARDLFQLSETVKKSSSGIQLENILNVLLAMQPSCTDAILKNLNTFLSGYS